MKFLIWIRRAFFNRYSMLGLVILQSFVLVGLYQNNRDMVTVLHAPMHKQHQTVYNALCCSVRLGDLVTTTEVPCQIKSKSSTELKHCNHKSMQIATIHTPSYAKVNKGDIIVDFNDAEIEKNVFQTKTKAHAATVDYIQAKTSTVTGRALTSGELVTKQAETDARAYEFLAALYVKENTARIRAPFNGTLGEIKVAEGQTIDHNTVIVKIVDTDNLNISLYLSEAQVANVNVNDEVEFYTVDPKITYKAVISEISPFVEESHNKIAVKAAIVDDRKSTLKVNGCGTCVLRNPPLKSVKLLPIDCLVDLNGRQYISKVTQRNGVIVSGLVEVVILGTKNGFFAFESDEIGTEEYVIFNGPKRDGVRIKFNKEKALDPLANVQIEGITV